MTRGLAYAACDHATAGPYRGDGRIRVCASCGLVFLAPEMRIPDLDAYYAHGSVWRDRAGDPVLAALARDDARGRWRLIMAHAHAAGTALLDIGSHEGTFVAEARVHGFAACGIEPNARLVAAARMRHIPLTEGSAESFSLPGTFNIITMFHVLEHISDIDRALLHIIPHLARDGALVLEVPDIESRPAVRHGLSWKYIAREHVRYFSRQTLADALCRHGFEIVFATRRNGEIPYLSFADIRDYFISRGGRPRDRFAMKRPVQHPLMERPRYFPVRRAFSSIIHAIGGADHLFVIARRIS